MKHNAEKIQRDMWWRNKKMLFVLVGIGVLVVGFIVLVAVIATK
jgi:flagellar biosynthesis/type III secretory pathway M-ring protein FliF/YscJ